LCKFISVHEKYQNLLKSLASTSRLKILECIREGISEPSQIGVRLGLANSTIIQHLNILIDSKIVTKSLSESGGVQSLIKYEIVDDAEKFISTILDACEKFLE
jgi:predicted transcriptional regulator